MRQVVSAACVVTLLFACSEPSRVDPEADVTVEGTVMRQDGRPVGGAQVILTREPGIGEVASIVFSIGFACLEAKVGEVCGRGRRAEAGPDGTFAFGLKGRDTQTSGGSAAVMELATRLPRAEGELDGPGISVRHLVQAEQVTIPMRAWEPTIELTGDARTASVSWSGDPGTVLPAEANLAASATHVRFATTDAGLVWAQPLPSGGTFDARVLEDTRGAVSVEAAVPETIVDDTAGSKVTWRLSSARFGYAGPAGRPVSRGKPCTAGGPGREPVRQAGCGVTDGDFFRRFEPQGIECEPGEVCEQPNEVTIDLGQTRTLQLVVVRGCLADCVVTASPDGISWQTVGAGAGFEGSSGEDNFALAVPAAVSSRYVRVAGSLTDLREVSVWDDSPPAPQAQPGESLIVAPDQLPDREAGGNGGGRTESGLVLAAVAALLLAMAGSLYLRRRTRST